MKLFHCPSCEQRLFYESVECTGCGRRLAYIPDAQVITSLEPAGLDAVNNELYCANDSRLGGRVFRRCQNDREYGVCNWAVDAHDPVPYCQACRLNETIPDLAVPEAAQAWHRLERAKRRLLYSLTMIGLAARPKSDDTAGGLAFAFLADENNGEKKHFTGHKDGVITINIVEADDASREKMRQELGEAYRTLLGHFRHEIGHYFWDRLVRDGGRLDVFRAEFGDERDDYQSAMQRHYENGPPNDWTQNYVSAYATMHPWEDWAETWAHYMHMVDSVETAMWHGIVLQPDKPGRLPGDIIATRTVDFGDFKSIMAAWIPLTVTLNSLNRGMGLPDLYPFILHERAIRKLAFVHNLVRAVATVPPVVRSL